jgi:hypothetical protein
MNKEKIIELVGNKFFTISFIKKDGTLRKMNARLGVIKHLKGGKKSYNPDDFNYLTVFDLGKKQYRTVNLNTVKEVKANKETLTF